MTLKWIKRNKVGVCFEHTQKCKNTKCILKLRHLKTKNNVAKQVNQRFTQRKGKEKEIGLRKNKKKRRLE